MVVKEEYISEDITIHDLLPLSFLKKSPYTGSKGTLRYRIEKIEKGEEPDIQKLLLVSTWTTPFAFDKTPEEEIKQEEFAFSQEGIEDILRYLNRVRKEELA